MIWAPEIPGFGRQGGPADRKGEGGAGDHGKCQVAAAGGSGDVFFFEIKSEKDSEASDHPVHDDSHKMMFFNIHQTHQIPKMFGILAASL